ncbi:MAG: Nif3-like dinuclear metal center hexameric protein [Lachnospiraceae bacterium]|nr:Nif3-like dinuclear metal center hexameric protein [Lachnospiraceae bacterium]
MKCAEILKALYELAPLCYAEEWDNSGLLVGSERREVRRVYIALDALDFVVEHAVKARADLLVTHHPLIFRPLKSVTDENFISERVLRLAEAGISCFAMHTNFDVCVMASQAALDLELKNPRVLSPTGKRDGEPKDEAPGFGMYGDLPRPMHLNECVDFVKEKFGLAHVNVFGDPRNELYSAAVVPGSGGSFVSDAVRSDADVLITGDVSYHEGIDAVMQGVCVIDAGHYGIEKLFVPYMEQFFVNRFPELEIISEQDTMPFGIV